MVGGQRDEPMAAQKDDEALVGDVLLSVKSGVIGMRGTLSMHFDYVVS